MDITRLDVNLQRGSTLGEQEGNRIGLLRFDSGFYSGDIFDYPEDNARKTDYITAVPMQRPVQRKITEHKAWLRIDSGIEITEFEYQG